MNLPKQETLSEHEKLRIQMRFGDDKIIPVTYTDTKFRTHGGLLYMYNDSAEHLILVLSHQPYFSLRLQVSASGCQMHPDTAYNSVSLSPCTSSRLYGQLIHSWKWEAPSPAMRTSRVNTFQKLRETVNL